MESMNGGIVLLLMVAENSEQLRKAIEENSAQGTRLPPTKQDGIKKDKERLEKATANDIITRKDYTANGIVCLTDWPSGTDGAGRASGVRGQPSVQRQWDKDTNRNLVINLKNTLQASYEKARDSDKDCSGFRNAFDSAQTEVKSRMKDEGRTDADKLVARTVLYLFQLLATVIWWVSGFRRCTHPPMIHHSIRVSLTRNLA